MPEPSFEHDQQHASEIVHSLEEENREDLEAVTQTLSKIMHLPSDCLHECLPCHNACLLEGDRAYSCQQDSQYQLMLKGEEC